MSVTPVPVSYAVPDEHTSPRFAGAFAQGCGGPATNDNVLLPGPVALFGSPARQELLAQAKREGRTYYYADHGFYRRGKYYRVAKNAVQYQPSLPAILRAKPDRFHATGLTAAPEWATPGASIVICPNSPQYMSWFGIDAHAWVVDLVDRLGQLTDRPIIVRWKSMASRRPLYLDLHNAYAVVVFSSNAAVEALTHGVPIFTLAPWASTVSLARTSIDQIESPYYPDHRIQFLWKLAMRQWTMQEIADGLAWKGLHDGQD